MTSYFVTAIGTDSGKTLVSAILCESFGADYWKPVQAGDPADSDEVRRLISNSRTRIHPERYKLTIPASPHAAAKADKLKISLSDFDLPTTANRLIVEGAGGCLVPLNDDDLVIDLMGKLKIPVIVVSNLYLGSINHTLLTAEVLRRRQLDIRGLVFNGAPNAESEKVIVRQTQWPVILRIGKEDQVDKSTVLRYASMLKENNYGGLD